MLKTFIDQVIIQLRHFREASELTQAEMAEKLNIGLRSYQRYESGESVPSLELLYEISQILNFKLKDLVSPEEECRKIPGFRIVEKNEFPEFIKHPDIVKSNLLKIASSESFHKMKEAQDLEIMLEDDAFMHSPFPMVIAVPKATLLNHCFKEKSGHLFHLIPTPQIHENKARVGIMWAYLMEKNPPAFELFMHAVFPKGPTSVMDRYLFETHKDEYFVVGVVDHNPSEPA